MKLPRIGSLVLLFPFTLLHASADTVDGVVARMDQAAKDFKSFTANMKRVDYDALFDTPEEKNGVVRVKRSGSALAGLMEFSDGQLDFFDGQSSGRYIPKMNTVERYDLTKRTASLFQDLFLVGFGARGPELTKNYEIKIGGAESVGSERTTRLELTPKSAEKRNSIAKIELWIPDGKGYPVQEKFTEPNKNYWLVTYTGMKLPAPPDTSFEPKLPAGVRTIYPGR